MNAQYFLKNIKRKITFELQQPFKLIVALHVPKQECQTVEDKVNTELF